VLGESGGKEGDSVKHMGGKEPGGEEKRGGMGGLKEGGGAAKGKE